MWLQCFKLYLASIGLQQNFHLGGHRPQQGGPGPPMPPRGDAPELDTIKYSTTKASITSHACPAVHHPFSTHWGYVQWLVPHSWAWHDYTIGTLDMLQACDGRADMGMTYSVIVQCADCVVFPWASALTVGYQPPASIYSHPS